MSDISPYPIPQNDAKSTVFCRCVHGLYARRIQGFDVTDIRGGAEQGITDEVLWQKAQQEKRLLITTDKE